MSHPRHCRGGCGPCCTMPLGSSSVPRLTRCWGWRVRTGLVLGRSLGQEQAGTSAQGAWECDSCAVAISRECVRGSETPPAPRLQNLLFPLGQRRPLPCSPTTFPWKNLFLPPVPLPGPCPLRSHSGCAPLPGRGWRCRYLLALVLAESLHGDGLRRRLPAVPQRQHLLAALLQRLHHGLVLVQGLLLVLARGNNKNQSENRGRKKFLGSHSQGGTHSHAAETETVASPMLKAPPAALCSCSKCSWTLLHSPASFRSQAEHWDCAQGLPSQRAVTGRQVPWCPTPACLCWCTAPLPALIPALSRGSPVETLFLPLKVEMLRC